MSDSLVDDEHQANHSHWVIHIHGKSIEVDPKEMFLIWVWYLRVNLTSISDPGKSGVPEFEISAKMQPDDQESTVKLYIRAPIRTSGGRYHSVTTSLLYCLTGNPTALKLD